MIKTGEKIAVPLKEMTHRRAIQVKEAYLLLEDNYVRYKMIAAYESKNDDTEVWEHLKCNYRYTRSRKDISGVDMGYNNEEDCYFVSIEFSGIADVSSWNYDDPKEALKLFTALDEYFTTTQK